MYLNNVDITSTIQRVEDLNTTAITKFVSFREPATGAAFAIKGFENNAVFEGVLGLRCSCTRVGSSWNFQSNIYAGWRTVRALSIQNDEFPAGWYTNEYNANSDPFVSAAADSFTLNPAVCGIVPTTDSKVKADQGSPVARFWAMRLFVTQRTGNCGTQGPTVAGASAMVGDGETSSTDNLWVIGLVVGAIALIAFIALVVVVRRRNSAKEPQAKDKEEENVWAESKDEDTGVAYWVNKKTGEFSWSDPKMKQQQQQLSVPSSDE